MLYLEDKQLSLWQGDRKPYALFKGSKQLAGAELVDRTGTDRIDCDSVYRAEIPSLKIYGLGKQDRIEGENPAPNPEYPIEPVWNSGNRIEVGSRNLFTSINGDINKVGVDIEYKDDGIIVLNGVVTRPSNLVFSKALKIPVKEGKRVTVNVESYGGTYSLADGEPNLAFAYSIFNSDYSNWIRGELNETNLGRYSFVRPMIPYDENGYYVMLQMWRIGTVFDNFQIKIMISESENIEPYVPYYDGGSVDVPVLRSIPDTDIRDEYNPLTGEIIRRVKEHVLTGNESWTKNMSYGDYESFYIDSSPLDILTYHSGTYSDMLCSHAPYDSWYNILYKKGNYWWFAGASLGMRIHKKYLGGNYDSLTEFKNFVRDQHKKGTPLKIWYPLKTPIIEQTTQVPLIQDIGGEIRQLGGELGLAPMDATVFKETDK